jgi:cytochrome c biogenesis protein CcmG/thiol:disulfide interchange protein DsbE
VTRRPGTVVRAWLAVVVVAVVAAACGGGRALPELDLRAEAAGVEPPVAGDVLLEGGWPTVAAFVADAAADGQATVVNLFASWCEPCADELPLLLEASAGTSDVRWLGVAIQDVQRNAVPFVEEFEVVWPTVLDLEGSTLTALGGVVMPTTAFFDRDGRLVSVVDGILDEDRLTRELAGIGA